MRLLMNAIVLAGTISMFVMPATAQEPESTEAFEFSPTLDWMSGTDILRLSDGSLCSSTPSNGGWLVTSRRRSGRDCG